MEPLSFEDIEVVSRASVQNAGELLEEAELLVRNGRYARSFFLARIALEEVMKPILFSFAGVALVTRRDPNWAGLDQALRAHTVKMRYALQSFAAVMELLGNPLPEGALDQMMDHVHELNRRKNEALYVSHHPVDGALPNEKFNEEQAAFMITFAAGFVAAAETHDYSRASIEQLAQSEQARGEAEAAQRAYGEDGEAREDELP